MEALRCRRQIQEFVPRAFPAVPYVSALASRFTVELPPHSMVALHIN